MHGNRNYEIDDIEARSAAKSHQPERSRGNQHQHRESRQYMMDDVGESTSNVDLERDSRQILDSDGLKSSNPSGKSSDIALS